MDEETPESGRGAGVPGSPAAAGGEPVDSGGGPEASPGVPEQPPVSDAVPAPQPPAEDGSVSPLDLLAEAALLSSLDTHGAAPLWDGLAPSPDLTDESAGGPALEPDRGRGGLADASPEPDPELDLEREPSPESGGASAPEATAATVSTAMPKPAAMPKPDVEPGRAPEAAPSAEFGRVPQKSSSAESVTELVAEPAAESTAAPSAEPESAAAPKTASPLDWGRTLRPVTRRQLRRGGTDGTDFEWESHPGADEARPPETGASSPPEPDDDAGRGTSKFQSSSRLEPKESGKSNESNQLGELSADDTLVLDGAAFVADLDAADEAPEDSPGDGPDTSSLDAPVTEAPAAEEAPQTAVPTWKSLDLDEARRGPRRVSVVEAASEPATARTPPPRPETELETTAETPPVKAGLPRRGDTQPLDVSALRRSTRRRARRWLVPAGVIVLVLGAGYMAAGYHFADRVPKGATVAGIPIGGLTAADATAKLESELADRAKEPVEAVIGEQSVVVDPVVAGLSFSAADTVGAVTGLDFNPVRLWRQVAGLKAVSPALVVDQDALDAELHELGSQAEVAPVDGAVSVATGEVVTTDAVDGTALDEAKARGFVRDNYLVTEGPWTLPVTAAPPRISQAEVERAVTEVAEPLLSGPVQVKVEDATVEAPVAGLAAAALIQAAADADALELVWDQDLLTATVGGLLPAGLVTSPANARFVFEGDQVVIQDGVAGTALDGAALAKAMTPAALVADGERVAEAVLVVSDPAEDRAELESMGVKEMVARFETQATNNADRTKNLRKAAEMVTGTLVRPGETFSLDEALGHRSTETGWFDAGVVVDGVSQQGIGGGLSQFSTTLYNASHLAGMVDVSHTPHSNYFSRYPMGREATLWEGQIDNQFKNDTPHGVVLRAGVTDSLRVWVELWSTKYWAVEAEIGEPYSYTAARTVESAKPDCTPQAAGSSGFQVDYWRVKTAPDGAAQPKEEWHWRYDPMNGIVCTAESE